MALAAENKYEVFVVGRSARRGKAFADKHGVEFRSANVEDNKSLRDAVDGSHVVVHTAGPFQSQNYNVAEACITVRAHYLDLADGREFVCGIGALNDSATAANVLVTSGVSSVPAITSAMFLAIAPEFRNVDDIQIALSPGNQNPRGDSTIAAVLSYLGKPIRVWQDGNWTTREGWSDAQLLTFPSKVGRRRVFNCDVPDLDLFPERLPVRTMRFRAGLELGFLNAMLSSCGAIARRYGVSFVRHAGLFRRISLLLYPFGSKNGSLAMWVSGRDASGKSITRSIAIVTDNDGPATPTAVAIVLARQLLTAAPVSIGAMPCFGLVNFRDIMAQLEPLGIWSTRGDESGWHPSKPGE